MYADEPSTETDAAGASSGHVAAAELRSIVERIERLDEEIKAINDDKKDCFSEAKSRGFDVKAIKQIIAIRRKDPQERQEHEAILDVYMAALGMD